MPEMALARFENDAWSATEFVASDSLTLHPGAHVLHYASTCFEGLKAFRHADGSVNIFRMDANIRRMQQSAELLNLPAIDPAQLREMIINGIQRFADQVPEAPGSMYIRPTLIGTDAAIGKAAAPSDDALLYVLFSPVGDYFAGGGSALTLLLEENGMRCAPHMGMVKSGGNYASALGPILSAKSEYQADQVLFCPNGDVQETGAANFLLIDGDEVITKGLDSTFLHGITRDSILTIARDLGMTVSERNLTVDELVERATKPGAEAALSGTAAVLTPVGRLIRHGKPINVGSDQSFEKIVKLRRTLNEIQWGQASDPHGWLTPVA